MSQYLGVGVTSGKGFFTHPPPCYCSKNLFFASQVVEQLTNPEKQAKCKPQSISNLVWAFATLGLKPKKRQLTRLRDEASKQLSAFKPQELANTLWAYASLDQYPGGPFLGAVAAEVKRQIGHFKPQELSNSIWAYATLRHHPGVELLTNAIKQVRSKRSGTP
jgi:hypothetical protein